MTYPAQWQQVLKLQNEIEDLESRNTILQRRLETNINWALAETRVEELETLIRNYFRVLDKHAHERQGEDMPTRTWPTVRAVHRAELELRAAVPVVKSRSVLRREAIQRGESMPEFHRGHPVTLEDAEAEYHAEED